MQLELAHAARHAQTPDRDRRGAAATAFGRPHLAAFHAEHQFDQPGAVEAGCRLVGHHRAVTQHHDLIADGEDLVQPVRDVDDAVALGDGVADRAEHPLGLRVAEARRGFVEDQHPGVAPEQAGDLEQLALAHPQRLHARRQRQVPQPDALQQHLSGGVTPAPPRQQRLPDVAQEQVVGDAQRGDDAELLIDERDTVRLRVLRVTELDTAPVDPDLPVVQLTKPTSAFTSVLLPAPLCPHRATTDELGTEKETPRSAWMAP